MNLAPVRCSPSGLSCPRPNVILLIVGVLGFAFAALRLNVFDQRR